ncbi:MAG TPA: DnaJ family domain-containing protein [Methylibium sp.]
MPTLDELIAQGLSESEANGELRAAPSYGRPLDFGDGYDETPIELRMPFKVLKDAGFVPHEVTMLRELAELRRRLAAGVSAEEEPKLTRRISELQQDIALRLEKLSRAGAL